MTLFNKSEEEPLITLDAVAHTYKLNSRSLIIGIRGMKDGDIFFNGNFNSTDMDDMDKGKSMRFMNMCRGVTLALKHFPYVFEMLGKQEHLTTMQFMKDTKQYNEAVRIERLQDTNVVKVEFEKR